MISVINPPGVILKALCDSLPVTRTSPPAVAAMSSGQADDPHTSRYPSLERGRQIMADAYADECRRLGREPVQATYERLRGFDPATLPDA